MAIHRRLSPWMKAALAMSALCIAVEVWRRIFRETSSAGIVLAFLVTFCSYQWGRLPGLVSSLIALAYLFYFYSEPGSVFAYTSEESNRLITFVFFIPAFAIMAARRREMHIARERLIAEKAWRGDERLLMASRLRQLSTRLELLRTHSQKEEKETAEIISVMRRIADITDPTLSVENPEVWLASEHPDEFN